LTGLSPEAINAAFSEFLNAALYTEEQIQMVNCIIDWLKKHGTLQPEEMKKKGFFGGLNGFEVWGHDNKIIAWRKLEAAIQSVNRNAERSAA
jgi:type I restriction enzyme R subunit